MMLYFFLAFAIAFGYWGYLFILQRRVSEATDEHKEIRLKNWRSWKGYVVAIVIAFVGLGIFTQFRKAQPLPLKVEQIVQNMLETRQKPTVIRAFLEKQGYRDQDYDSQDKRRSLDAYILQGMLQTGWKGQEYKRGLRDLGYTTIRTLDDEPIEYLKPLKDREGTRMPLLMVYQQNVADVVGHRNLDPTATFAIKEDDFVPVSSLAHLKALS
jgi:hypothetical protein